jgi:hypothetical protein
MMPADTFGTSGFGTNVQLLPGAQVFGIFLDGKDSQLPMILGSVPKTEYPSTVQSQDRLDPAVNIYAYNYDELIEIQEGYDITQDKVRISIALKFFIDLGYTKEQTCGIVGCLYAVSKLEPTFTKDALFRGISGWNINTRRWIRFRNFAGTVYKSDIPERLDLQLQYVQNELRTTEKTANGRLRFAKTVVDTDYDPVKLCRERRYNGATSVVYYYYLPLRAREFVKLGDCETHAKDFYDNLMSYL